MKSSIPILLLIGAISLEESQAISLQRHHHGYGDGSVKKTHHKKTGKHHKKKGKHHKKNSDLTTEQPTTTTTTAPLSGSTFAQQGMLHHVAADDYMHPARYSSLQTQSNSMYDHWTQENNDVSNNVGYVADQPASYTVEPLDLDAVQTNYDCWDDENNNKSNNLGYVADGPADYAVEPADIDLQTNSDMHYNLAKNVRAKYDTWTVQEHGKHSNAVDYQADSPTDYVVEPLDLTAMQYPSYAQKYLGGDQYDHWVAQEHDKHSNAVDYQADSPADYVVEGSTKNLLAQQKLGYDIWTVQEHDKHSNVADYQADAPQGFVVEGSTKNLLAQKKMRYDTWTDQEHDKNSNVVDYQADSPQPFVVEPAVLPESLVQKKMRYDTWTTQEHDKNSNVVDYQADSPQPFVVEPRELPIATPGVLAQLRYRTLPDVPYTNAGGNVGTNGGDAVEGMVGNEDLGEHAIVGADSVNYRRSHVQHRTLPDVPYTNAGGNVGTNGGDAVEGMVGNEDLGASSTVGGSSVNYRRQYGYGHH